MSDSYTKSEDEFLSDVNHEVEQLVDAAKMESSQYREEILRAYRSRNPKGPKCVSKAARFEYSCVRSSGGTLLERWGIECVRCAWYIRDGSTSERVTPYEFSCAKVPDRVAQ